MEYCNDFSHDLKFGQLGEEFIGELFSSKKIEIKRDTWITKTGNIAVEYEYKSNPSGIAKSKADYWCFIVSGDMNDKIIIFIETVKLKEIARHYFSKRKIKEMGDNNKSKAILIPYKQLLNFTDKDGK